MPRRCPVGRLFQARASRSSEHAELRVRSARRLWGRGVPLSNRTFIVGRRLFKALRGEMHHPLTSSSVSAVVQVRADRLTRSIHAGSGPVRDDVHVAPRRDLVTRKSRADRFCADSRTLGCASVRLTMCRAAFMSARRTVCRCLERPQAVSGVSIPAAILTNRSGSRCALRATRMKRAPRGHEPTWRSGD